MENYTKKPLARGFARWLARPGCGGDLATPFARRQAAPLRLPCLGETACSWVCAKLPLGLGFHGCAHLSRLGNKSLLSLSSLDKTTGFEQDDSYGGAPWKASLAALRAHPLAREEGQAAHRHHAAEGFAGLPSGRPRPRPSNLSSPSLPAPFASLAAKTTLPFSVPSWITPEGEMRSPSLRRFAGLPSGRPRTTSHQKRGSLVSESIRPPSRERSRQMRPCSSRRARSRPSSRRWHAQSIRSAM